MRRVRLASTVMLCAWLVVGSTGAGAEALPDPVAERMRPVVPAAIEYYNERSPDPLAALSTEQIEELLRGEVVRIRRRPAQDVEDPSERVTGYRIVMQPRARVWVAALDPGFQATDLLTEHRLGEDETGASLWHQYLSLPWPVSDRQWVIRVGQRRDLAAETEDLVWELYWELAKSGEALAVESLVAGNLAPITPEAAKDAVYVPANEGSWIMFRLEEGLTLVGYRVIARVGGSIPDSWIASFGMAQLTKVLNGVADHATEVPSTYDPDVYPILGGDGLVIKGLREGL